MISVATSVAITALTAAILGLMQVVFTLRVGMYRQANQISLGDGGDKELEKRMRAHGNFIETVPMALILILLNEISGASSTLLYGLAAVLIVARLMHYISIAYRTRLIFRVIGMLSTLLVIAVAALALLVG